jgi:hypothetical protein
VLESAGTLDVRVTRVGALDSAVTVDYAFSNGLATNGVDFAGASGTLTFGVGITQQFVTVTITNDAVVEPDKTFSIQLSNAGGEAVLGTRTLSTVTILNDDSVIQFPAATINVSESAQNATINVQRIGATNVSVTASLSTADGTALSTSHYGPVTTNLTFAVGENLKSFVVPVTNDFVASGSRVFHVLLNSVTNDATIGTNSDLTVQIIDDDFRTFAATGYAVVAESYQPTNNAIDPLETVTVNFSLHNIGNVDSPDVTATLLASGGVSNPSGPQIYTNLTSAGPARSS